MKTDRGDGMFWWAAVTILTSAFLLFQVQPIISKTILPWFGGSPAVWTTCVLFFQVLLLGGYGYAHGLTKYCSPLWQGRVHAALLAIAVLTLPIVPDESWKPIDGTSPALRILVLLTMKVGAPYFLLSSSGPLVQSWFALAYPGRSPYRLYALSNVGSLAALLSYPFFFEPTFAVNTQGWLWSLSFAVFALLAGGLGIMVWRIASEMEIEAAAASTEPTSARYATPASVSRDVAAHNASEAPPPWYLESAWVMLAALASLTLLSFTSHLSTDIAPSPFIWVAPLSLYLLSFIICFDRELWYFRPLWGTLGVLLVGLLCAMDRAVTIENYASDVRKLLHLPETSFSWSDLVDHYDDNIKVQGAIYMAVFFVTCMLCHGEIVKSKPAPKYLTRFYLMISFGGALGGIFVGLICPIVFTKPVEISIAVVGTFVVAWVALLNACKSTILARKELLQWSSAFVIVGLVLLICVARLSGLETGSEVILQTRNFYGTIWVKEDTTADLQAEIDAVDMGQDIAHRSLYHGRILHGTQFLAPERMDEATTYYDDLSGPGIAVLDYPGHRDGKPIRVAVVGLGTGTMAAHARDGDYYCFYDIDPKVVALHTQLIKIGNKEEHVFKFLDRAKERGATVEITLGDARIRMEKESQDVANPKNYDVIVLDAFSGDAIPSHLLTVEALQIYEKQMRHVNGKNEGILAIHISNRYLDLAPVVNALARQFNFQQVPVHLPNEDLTDRVGDSSSDWILLTRNEEFLADRSIQRFLVARDAVLEAEKKEDQKAVAKGLRPKVRELLWTDQQSANFPILK